MLISGINVSGRNKDNIYFWNWSSIIGPVKSKNQSLIFFLPSLKINVYWLIEFAIIGIFFTSLVKAIPQRMTVMERNSHYINVIFMIIVFLRMIFCMLCYLLYRSNTIKAFQWKQKAQLQLNVEDDYMRIRSKSEVLKKLSDSYRITTKLVLQNKEIYENFIYLYSLLCFGTIIYLYKCDTVNSI